MNDQLIFRQLQENDPKGLERIFDKYYPFLTRTAFYITGDRQTAEDITQDLFVKLWDRRQQMGGVKNLKGYLIASVKNSAYDYLQGKNTSTSRLEQYLYFAEKTVETSIEKPDDLKVKISLALSQLPPKCRLIFSMNRFEGLTNSEIAEYLEISKRTVETQISKALKQLREELRSSWDQYLAGLLFNLIGLVAVL